MSLILSIMLRAVDESGSQTDNNILLKIISFAVESIRPLKD
jgi:hypothetical protein